MSYKGLYAYSASLIYYIVWYIPFQQEYNELLKFVLILSPSRESNTSHLTFFAFWKRENVYLGIRFIR